MNAAKKNALQKKMLSQQGDIALPKLSALKPQFQWDKTAAGVVNPGPVSQTDDHIKEAFVCTISAVENLSFPVKDKFLQVKSNGLCNAEIFCVLGYTNLKLFASTEKMIYCIPTCKYHTGVVLYLYLLFAEFFPRNGFKTNEWVELKLKIVFS